MSVMICISTHKMQTMVNLRKAKKGNHFLCLSGLRREYPTSLGEKISHVAVAARASVVFLPILIETKSAIEAVRCWVAAQQ